jgi:hypothetical protein
MDPPTADPPSPNMPAMLDVQQPDVQQPDVQQPDVQQPEDNSISVPVAPHPPEESKSKSTGQRKGRKKDPDAKKHKTVEVKNTTMVEKPEKLVVGEDGISRVNVNDIDTSSC